MNAVLQPSVLSFSGKYSKAEFNLTVEIYLEADSVITQSDYTGNYGFLTWYEDNGSHEVRSAIVSAIASAKTLKIDMSSVIFSKDCCKSCCQVTT
ncbi:hypothetical protein M5689_000118 [Euphorbia peplus]|nr:hypothetical protein M5689_000118 [Euphorbia peplus]